MRRPSRTPQEARTLSCISLSGPIIKLLIPSRLQTVVAQPVLIDARCTLDTELWLAAGWRVRVLGRSPAGKADIPNET